MNEEEILRPSEFARRLGVETVVVVRAMYDRRVPRVELDDGTLGIPASALVGFSAS